MLQVLTIVLAIAFSNVPPQTVAGETQGPSVTASASAEPTEPEPGGRAIDPPENQPGGGR